MRICIALLIALSLIVALSLPLPNAFGVNYAVGVSVGDWAEYTILGGWNTTEPSVDMPQFVRDARNTDRIQINVTRVSFTSVTILAVTQFKDGSGKSNVNVGDIRTGTGNLSLQVIGADLSEGDKLSEANEALTVNRTTTKTYAKAARTVNYAYSEEFASREIGDESAVYEFYWDRATGIVAAMSLVKVFESESYTTIASVMMEINETNVWQPEINSGLSAEWIITAVIVVSGTIAVVYLVMREVRAGRRRRRSRMSARLRRTSDGSFRTNQRAWLCA